MNKLLHIFWIALFTSSSSHLYAQSLEGLWRTDGYGLAFLIEDEAISLFDITSRSSIPIIEGRINAESLFFKEGPLIGVGYDPGFLGLLCFKGSS